jgi:hypothetical protein
MTSELFNRRPTTSDPVRMFNKPNSKEALDLAKRVGALFPSSPHPWSRDEVGNIYDAEGQQIFRPVAHNDDVGFMPENNGNVNFVVWVSGLL